MSVEVKMCGENVGKWGKWRKEETKKQGDSEMETKAAWQQSIKKQSKEEKADGERGWCVWALEEGVIYGYKT